LQEDITERYAASDNLRLLRRTLLNTQSGRAAVPVELALKL